MKRRLLVALASLALLLPACVGADDALPRAITVTAPVKFVNCGAGCCCGEITVRYMGHYYGDPSYCRWWRPGRAWPTLREGQSVTTTVALWR
jgi:hypothetical protein